MPDLKLSQLPELLPFDSYTMQGGIETSDYLTILDDSEVDPSLANKKIKISTLFENFSPSHNPIFTGLPTATTASIGDNSDRIATTAYVQNELTLNLSLDSLQDITINTTPLNNQVLTYDDLVGTFIPKSSTSNFSSQRLDLSTSYQLTSNNSNYLYISAIGGSQDLILTNPPSTNDFFYIVNRDKLNPINLKETSGGIVVQIIDTNNPVCQAHFDGVEWQLILP